MPAVDEGARATGTGRKPAAVPGNRSLQSSGSFAPKVTLPANWAPATRTPAAPSAPRPESRARTFHPDDVGNIATQLAALKEYQPPVTAATSTPSVTERSPEQMANPFTLQKGKTDQAIDTNVEHILGVADRQEKILKLRSNLDAAARVLRAHSIGADNAKPHGEVEAMTWEEYNALPSAERAAVDFNTMLVRAVRRDHKLQDDYDPNKQQRQTYDRAVEKMFGQDGGSEDYAPETMAVLRQIHFADSASDLDDFLGLKAAITAKDLKNYDQAPTNLLTESVAAAANPVQVDRSALQQVLVQGTEQMQGAVAKSQSLLATMNKTSIIDRNEDVARFLGGIAKAPGLDLGFGAPKTTESGAPADVNTYFQQMFDQAATGHKSADEIKQAVSLDLSPSEGDAFMRYLNTRSGNAARYNVDLGDAQGVKYKSPEEFRKMFGFDQVKTDG